MGARILLVEDEPCIQQFLAQVLMRMGCRVDAVAEGQTALAQLETAGYDLIMSDLKMAGMDGPTLYQVATRRWPHLRERFLFVTGDVLGQGSAEFLRTVAGPVLQKPFTVAQLEDVVRKGLEGGRA